MHDPATSERCLTFLSAQLAPRARANRPAPHPTVTISRLTGAGGVEIAERLAARLEARRPGSPAPWTVFHRTLVEKVLEDHNLPAKLAEYMPEDRVSYLHDALEELLGLHPSRTSLETQVIDTILKLAELGDCIIIGRGAHVILAKSPTCLHVRLISSLEKRVERVMAQKQLSEAEAAEFIRREDTARKRFLKAQFDADIDDPFGYHLILNTDQFNPDQASELIAEAVMTRFPV